MNPHRYIIMGIGIVVAASCVAMCVLETGQVMSIAYYTRFTPWNYIAGVFLGLFIVALGSTVSKEQTDNASD